MHYNDDRVREVEVIFRFDSNRVDNDNNKVEPKKGLDNKKVF